VVKPGQGNASKRPAHAQKQLTACKEHATMRMKAAVLRAPGKSRPYADSHPRTIETVDLDPPGSGAVLYKTIGAGLRQVLRPHA
jgi:hypothetical protein